MSLLFILILIITIHESGHFIAAKLCKCGVTKFSIGFGKPLFQFKIKETTYQITPLLFGGFCELKDEMAYSRSKYSFTNKTYAQKVFISIAGSLMNVVSAVIAFVIFKYNGNGLFFKFAYYSIVIGLSNLLPIPALDGSFWIAYLFEPKQKRSKKRQIFFQKLNSLFHKWFVALTILNVLCIPYIGYLLWTNQLYL